MTAAPVIYLDYAATTPTDPEVASVMADCLRDDWCVQANPSSRHAAGSAVSAEIESARVAVAAGLGAAPDEIVWTSGATESNNLALRGAIDFLAGQRGHIVSSRIEHKSVIDTLRWLESRGTRVTWLTPGADGRIAVSQVAEVLTPETTLVSLMHVNNETGAINDIAEIGRLTREQRVMFHVDAAQSVGKLPIDVEAMNIDLLSASAHKFYGPRGIGFLYVRRRPMARISAQQLGGGQERGLRAGTLPLHQIAGLARAMQLAQTRMLSDRNHVLELNQRLCDGLAGLAGLHFNSDAAIGWPGIVNLSIEGVDGESLFASMPQLAISRGSACTAATLEPSYVLRAMGRSDALADASLRFSFGRATCEADIDTALDCLIRAVGSLRQLSPEATPVDAGVSAPSDSETAENASADMLPALEIHELSPQIDKYFRDRRRAARSFGNADVLRGEAVTAASRARMVIVLQVAGDKVVKAGFHASGCVATIATAAWACEWLEGRSLSEAQTLDVATISAALALPMQRRHCAVMVCEAVAQALQAVNQFSEQRVENRI